MLFSWLKKRRRRQILAKPFPAQWIGYLERNVPQYRLLSPAEQAKLRDDVQIFIAEKHWEGCGGLTMTDEIRVTIAAQACLLVLAMDGEFYDRVPSILVYPAGYRVPESVQRGTGVIDQAGEGRLGESWYRGPVVLSWADVLAEGRTPGRGHNLVFHEFAHQLDMLDGPADGTPPLPDADHYRRWQSVMTDEFRHLVQQSEHGQATLLDTYGAQNEAEFFAVATECFFDRPEALARRHSRMYDLLRDYYRQDPARRVREAS